MHMVPSEYLPLEQAPNFQAESIKYYGKFKKLGNLLNKICRYNQCRNIFNWGNHTREKKEPTLVLSRITNINVVLRGLNNRIITC